MCSGLVKKNVQVTVQIASMLIHPVILVKIIDEHHSGIDPSSPGVIFIKFLECPGKKTFLIQHLCQGIDHQFPFVNHVHE